MTIAERISAFIAKHPEPTQYQITLCWKRKDGYHEQTFGDYQLRSRRLHKSVGHPIYASHYLYDEKLQMCELAFIEFPHNTPKANENRKWSYVYRYFVDNDSRELYCADGTTGQYKFVRTSYQGTTYDKTLLARNLSSLCNNVNNFQQFVKFCGDRTQLGGCWARTLTNEWNIEYWFKYKNKIHTDSKTQQIIDKLSTIQLPSIESLNLVMPDHWFQTTAYYDKVNGVFRVFDCSMHAFKEIKRIYMYNKKIYIAALNDDNVWVPNGSFTANQFSCSIQNFDDVYSIPYFEYYKKIGKNNRSVYYVVSCLKHPEIEQLAGMGFTHIASQVLGQTSAELKALFGEPNKKKNVLQKYEVTYKQAQMLEHLLSSQNYYNYSNTIAIMKQYLGKTQSMDDISFKMAFKFFARTDGWRIRYIGVHVTDRSSWMRIVRRTTENDNYLIVLSDTISMWSYLNIAEKPSIESIVSKNYDELVTMHNQINALKRAQQEENRRLRSLSEAQRNAELEKKMTKLNQARAHYNYADDNFEIRVPEKLMEITEEGMNLHHCVGGYVDRHARGETTIIFLRKKSEPNKSFYTIELKNDNCIQQIHGFGNKWLGNDPDAVPTVLRWIKKNNINCSKNILLSTAKGYSSYNAPLIAMPAI